jgi:hypothetical protein
MGDYEVVYHWYEDMEETQTHQDSYSVNTQRETALYAIEVIRVDFFDQE